MPSLGKPQEHLISKYVQYTTAGHLKQQLEQRSIETEKILEISYFYSQVWVRWEKINTDKVTHMIPSINWRMKICLHFVCVYAILAHNTLFNYLIRQYIQRRCWTRIERQIVSENGSPFCQHSGKPAIRNNFHYQFFIAAPDSKFATYNEGVKMAASNPKILFRKNVFRMNQNDGYWFFSRSLLCYFYYYYVPRLLLVSPPIS